MIVLLTTIHKFHTLLYDASTLTTNLRYMRDPLCGGNLTRIPNCI